MYNDSQRRKRKKRLFKPSRLQDKTRHWFKSAEPTTLMRERLIRLLILLQPVVTGFLVASTQPSHLCNGPVAQPRSVVSVAAPVSRAT
jgi:hypothetical protein